MQDPRVLITLNMLYVTPLGLTYLTAGSLCLLIVFLTPQLKHLTSVGPKASVPCIHLGYPYQR